MYSKEVIEIGDQIYFLIPAKATELLDYLKVTYNIVPIALPQKQEKLPEPEIEKPVEKTEFTVILESYDATKKIALVKAYRDVTSAGLKDAMGIVNACPSTIKENVSKEEAEKLKTALEACGGKVILK